MFPARRLDIAGLALLAAALAWPADPTRGEPNSPPDRPAAAQTTSGQPDPATPTPPAEPNSPDKAPTGKPGWLGLRLVPVPEALAAHLQRNQTNDIYGQGVMVKNLIAGSPADRAGFRRYDVIVALNGQPVNDELTGFVEKLAGFKQNQKLDMVIIRHGRLRPISVTLGARPAPDAPLAYKYETTVSRVVKDRVTVEGQVYQRRDGRWVGQPITQANRQELIQRMPADIREKIRQWAGDPQDLATRVRVLQDGLVTEVSRDANGRYIVRRYREDDTARRNVVTRIYTNLETFMAEDPLGLRIYHTELAADAGPTDGLKLLAELEEAEVQVVSGTDRRLAGSLDDGPAQASPSPSESAAIQREFSVDERGRITVRIHARGTTLSFTFANENDFRKKQPDLFRYYRAVVNALQ